ncbi:MAG: hypothetical protein ACREUR_07660 [Nitrosospira sp.]|jgi:hypothetical protein
MKPIVLLAVPITLAVMFAANAGTLNNGSWSPSGCGAMPAAPNVNLSNIDSLNRSITAVNDWQKQLQIYDQCMIREANADTAAISNAANAEQVRYREASARINAELASGRDKLGSDASPAGIGPGNPGFGNPGMGNPSSGGQGY